MRNKKENQKQKMGFKPGFTLIEVVMAVLIIGISVIGILVGVIQATKYSADPMVINQGIAIAESYLQEITAKPLPGAPLPGAAPPYTCSLPCAGSPPASRANYATVCDYKGIPAGGQVPTDITGAAIPNLGNYTVKVAINDGSSGAVTIGPAGNQLTAAAKQVVRIDVTVSNPSMQTMVFSAYRACY